MTRLFVALAGALLASTVLAAQPPLGRFFFTPAERAQLDVARIEKQKPAPQVAAAEAPPEPLPVPQTVTYGGIVRRSDGKSMLWINNRMVDERDALTGLNLRGRVRADGAVTLQVPQTGSSVEVKVGQSVEVHTGRVAEGKRNDEPESAKEPKGVKAEETKAAAPAVKADEPQKASPVASNTAQKTPAAMRAETAQEQALRPREDPKAQRSPPAGR